MNSLYCYGKAVIQIGQRELRNDNATIMRRVERGESFTVSRRGKPIADLIPHQPDQTRGKYRSLADAQAAFRRLPPIDRPQWYRDRASADEAFGSDDPLQDPWKSPNGAKTTESSG